VASKEQQNLEMRHNEVTQQLSDAANTQPKLNSSPEQQ